jgi:uncharacterized protein (DUF305 family)
MRSSISRRRLFWPGCLVLTLGSGCGATLGEPDTPGPAEATPSADFEALYRARADSATRRFSEADVRFVTDMIGHHLQALEMAWLVPDRSDHPALEVLAARIVNGQEAEIETMRRWLSDRGRSAPDPAVPTAAHAHLPGMATPDELIALADARGRDFDVLLLTLMIRHHQGAVAMVHDLFATDRAAQGEATFRLASDIQVDQITEIARMEQMLATLSSSTPR